MRRVLRAAVSLALPLAFVVGCDLGTDPEVRIIAGLIPVAGDGQFGQPGNPLPKPLVVQVIDLQGEGVPGVAVAWEVVSGDGTVAPPITNTDSNGHASASFILGLTPGIGGVRAYVAQGGAEDLEVLFGATGVE